MPSPQARPAVVAAGLGARREAVFTVFTRCYAREGRPSQSLRDVEEAGRGREQAGVKPAFLTAADAEAS